MHSKKLLIEHSRGVELVPLEAIIYCEADDNWTRVVLADNTCSKICQTLKAIEGRIDDDAFLRVHRSYLINFIHVTKVQGNYEGLYLTDDQIVPVSRRKRPLVRMALKQILNCI